MRPREGEGVYCPAESPGLSRVAHSGFFVSLYQTGLASDGAVLRWVLGKITDGFREPTLGSSSRCSHPRQSFQRAKEQGFFWCLLHVNRAHHTKHWTERWVELPTHITRSGKSQKTKHTHTWKTSVLMNSPQILRLLFLRNTEVYSGGKNQTGMLKISTSRRRLWGKLLSKRLQMFMSYPLVWTDAQTFHSCGLDHCCLQACDKEFVLSCLFILQSWDLQMWLCF